MSERKPAVLIVDDEEKLRRFLRKEFERKGHLVRDAACGDAALAALASEPIDVMLLDIILPGEDGLSVLAKARDSHPDVPVVMLTGNASVETAVRAMKLGACDYLSKPYDIDALLLIVEKAHAQASLRREIRSLRLEHGIALEGQRPAEAGPASAALAAELERLADLPTPVLFEGEPGAGKRFAARAMHRLGPCASAPFLAVDAGAYEAAPLEARLFGEGPLKGLLELAGRGMVFISDAGRLPAPCQDLLLQAFDTGSFRRREGTVPIRLRCRVAASASDLENDVRQRRLDRKLLDRLSVSRVRILPLRERPEEVAPLAKRFMARQRASSGRGPTDLAGDARLLLERHPWPGNIRQLQGVIERACLRAEGLELRAGDIFLPRSGDGPTEAPETLAAVERSHILKVLSECGGNRTRAASILGVDPKTLYNKLKEYRGPR